MYVRPPGYRSRLRWIIPLLVGLAIVFPFLATKYLLTVAILGLIYVLLGLGLNIVVGLAGLLDLGYVAFYAIGAYGPGAGLPVPGLGFWAMLPLGAVMAALAGALLGFPVLRMHGDYLAIVTLGFGEIIRPVLNNWVSFTGALTAYRCHPPRCLASSLPAGPRMAASPSMSFSTSATTPT